MSFDPPLFWCLGGVLVDHIGRTHAPVQAGQSNPGAARLRPGGVAFNIAKALSGHGANAALMGAIGRDIGGDMIAMAITEAGIEDQLIRTDQPTGAYLAIEGGDGDLHAGVSDLTALETLPIDTLVAHLAKAPPKARIIVDANLTADQLFKVAARPGWLAAEAVSAPKAQRLVPLMPSLNAMFCNLSEAATLTPNARTARDAARTLSLRMAGTVFVTDGPRPAAVAQTGEAWTLTPPPAPSASVTGAGDAFTAGALMALANEAAPEQALKNAIAAAAAHLESQT